MKFALIRFFGGFLVFAVSLTLTSRAQDAAKSSPFIANGPGGPGPVAATPDAPLELRGIITSPNGNSYGIYDPVKRQSGWVKLNEGGWPYVVRTSDGQKDSITVEYQGRILTLALKSAKIDTLAPGSIPTPWPAPGQLVMNPANRAPGPTPSDETTRNLERIAAEVQRRRMARQAAENGGPQPNGQAPVPPNQMVNGQLIQRPLPPGQPIQPLPQGQPAPVSR